MIISYFTLAETIKAIKKQRCFIALSICALVDTIHSLMLWISKLPNVEMDYEAVNYSVPLSIALFLIFSFMYAASKTDEFKYKKVYLFITFTFCLLVAALYAVWSLFAATDIVYIALMIAYEGYTVTRLIFAIHYNKRA